MVTLPYVSCGRKVLPGPIVTSASILVRTSLNSNSDYRFAASFVTITGYTVAGRHASVMPLN
jgi:hypothetical protein